MEKNEKSDIGHLEKLALLSDAVKDIFPDGKTTIAFELNKEDYKTIQGYFRKIDINFNRFQIDISGTEFLFLNESYFQELEKKESEIEKPKEEPIEIKKMGFWNKIYSLLSSKKSS
jgi:hypothetical protein